MDDLQEWRRTEREEDEYLERHAKYLRQIQQHELPEDTDEDAEECCCEENR